MTLNTKPTFTSSHPSYHYAPSSFTVKGNFLAMGGMEGDNTSAMCLPASHLFVFSLPTGLNGELTCKSLETQSVIFSRKIAEEDNAITNALDVVENINGSEALFLCFLSTPFFLIFPPPPPGSQLIVSSNDRAVRLYDVPSMELMSTFDFEWPVNVGDPTEFNSFLKIFCFLFFEKKFLLSFSTHN